MWNRSAKLDFPTTKQKPARLSANGKPVDMTLQITEKVVSPHLGGVLNACCAAGFLGFFVRV